MRWLHELAYWVVLELNVTYGYDMSPWIGEITDSLKSFFNST